MPAPRKRVIITGSTGNLGEKAIAALQADVELEIIRLGRSRGERPDVIPADLMEYDGEWAGLFAGADAVLHLAADPKPVSDWSSIAAFNIEMSLNVLRAAVEGHVRRFVFASSNWVLGGYRFDETPLRSDTSPKPVNPYGASKLFVERLGLSLAAASGMSFLALRIGYTQKGDNLPGRHMAFGRWGQEMWLSNQDWAQSVVKSVHHPFEGSAVLNIVSRNAGMRWDLDEAARTIGYVPTDTHRPTLGVGGWCKDQLARIRDTLVPPGASEPIFGARW